MKEMSIRAVKSPIITSDDNLLEVLKGALNGIKLGEGDILAVSSKVVAVTQGRVVKINSKKEFKALVRQEADRIIEGSRPAPFTLTLKNGIFIPWTGIDRSNTKKGTAVLWPKNPEKIAHELAGWLRKTYRLRRAGVIIVDSFCVPLRKGVVGIALAHAGFKGVNDKRGTRDLYGNKLQFTQEAVADSVATMANFVMGQGNERTPFAIISNAPVTFSTKPTSPKDLIMKEKDCLYSPLYKTKMAHTKQKKH